jgi:antitoxin component of MazEF toxin-antitoxin module
MGYSLIVMKMKFNFGKRKIQKVGYSFLVPLPVDWIKNLDIGKGDSLKIEMLDDNSLRITSVLQARQDFEGTEGATPTK